MNSSRIPKENDLETDVVIIGGGGTGFAAATAAAENGAKVILLEKRRAPGGTSVFANGLCAAESPVHKLRPYCRRKCIKVCKRLIL
jgi:fumarate reductase flavoprotein subunit